MATTKKVIKKEKKAPLTTLPSLSVLFKDTWELFKKSIPLYGKLLGIIIGVIVFGGLGLFLLGLPLGISLIGAGNFTFFQPSAWQVVLMILFGLWALLFFMAMVMLSLFGPIANILIIANPASGIKEILRSAKSYIIVYFAVSLLSFFLVLGGFFVFLIPGLLISFFLAFIQYEIVLGNKKPLGALKGSYHLIKYNFWSVLGRFLLLHLGIILLSYILNEIIGDEGLLTVVTFLFNIAASWFASVYYVVLYRQVKAKTTTEPTSSLVWMWLLASVGWVLLAIGISTLWQYLPMLWDSLDNPSPKIPDGIV